MEITARRLQLWSSLASVLLHLRSRLTARRARPAVASATLHPRLDEALTRARKSADRELGR